MSGGPAPLVSEAPRVYCQCCRTRPQTLAEVIDGQVYTRVAMWDAEERTRVLHWRWITRADLATMDTSRVLRCDCCIPEAGRILAEFQDGLLIIWAKRHGRIHFVALSRTTLERVLAGAGQEAYASAQLPLSAP